MEGKTTRLTRKEMYEQVWSVPMTKLAKQYGMSDVGLAKICRKVEIPVPNRGYWAKKQYRRTPPATPLPNPDYNPDIEIHEQPAKDPTVQREMKNAKLEEPISVPETLRGAHPLVHTTLATLEACEVDDCGIIVIPRENVLNVRVSKQSLRRALRIMDGLIKALESCGYSIFLNDKEPGAVAQILKQDVGFRIEEYLENKKTENEVGDLSGRYTFHHDSYSHSQAPSGRLCLFITGGRWYYHTDGLRHKWSDGKQQRLENSLNSVISGMIACATRMAEAARKEAEEEKRRQAEEKKRQEKLRVLKDLAAKIKAEQGRVDAFIQEAADWRGSRLLREYVAAVRANAEKNREECDPGSERGKWIEWAIQQADRLDPLVAEKPPSILDRAPEVANLEAEQQRVW